MKTLRATLLKEFSFLYILPAVLWQVLFALVPIALILVYSLTSPDSWYPTLNNYLSIFNSVYAAIIFRSLFLALTTACTCLLLAYPVAYFLALRLTKAKNVMLFLLTLPFWVNFLIQIYAWYFLLDPNGIINSVLLHLGIISQRIPLANSLGAVYIVMVYCYLPFMIMPLYNALDKINKKLLEASFDLGATSWQTFWNITVPLSAHGIQTGMLLVLIPSFGEFVIPSLLGGSKYMLVGSLISYEFLVARNNAQGAALTYTGGFILICTLILLMNGKTIYRYLTRSPQ